MRALAQKVGADRCVPTAGRLDPSTVTAPSAADRAAVRHAPLPTTGPHPPLFAVLGAHGGAGTSTLARWWAPAADTGLAWPACPHTTQQVLIASRLCLPGLVAASLRLREWHAGHAPEGVTIIGLALTPARPGRIPTPVRRYQRVVAELVDRVFAIAWQDELLTTELDELAQFRPFDPPPPRRTRLRHAVPADVHRAGADIIAHLAASRSGPAAPPKDSENTL